MRIQLNLASRKFVELGPLYLRLRVLILILAVVAVPLWLLLGTEKRRAADAQARLDAVNHQIQALETQRQQFQAEMREPQNASVLSQAQFLNQMYASKAFSWTAVMMDLENVLPSGVQVLSIDPVISRNGKVTIRLRVNGPHERGVDLVRNLEHSRRFLAPRLARETAENSQQNGRLEQVSATPNVNFDLLAEYNPLPEKTENPAAAHDATHEPSAATTRHRKAAAKPSANAFPSPRINNNGTSKVAPR